MSALEQLRAATESNLDAANASLDAARQAQGEIARLATDGGAAHGLDPLVMAITVFVLAIFVGYYVVWKVTPALHTPLMAVTNAISGIIVVGAIIAAGPSEFGFATVVGFLAVTLASVNIFGGFMVTHRMLQMFKKKQ